MPPQGHALPHDGSAAPFDHKLDGKIYDNHIIIAISHTAHYICFSAYACLNPLTKRLATKAALGQKRAEGVLKSPRLLDVPEFELGATSLGKEKPVVAASEA